MRVPGGMRFQEMNPGRLTGLFLKQFAMSKVTKGETMVLLSDLTSRPEYVQAAFAAADELEVNAYEMRVNMIPSWTKVGVDTVGKTKGVMDALKAADIVVALHIPLFTSWLREVMSTGTRFLMIIDSPDDLELLLAPKGLKEAVKHSEARLTATKEVRVVSDAGTDLTYSCGDFPVMSQWGYSDEPGHFDHWGVGLIHTFPNELTANGTVVMAPGDIVILPYCRYVHDEVRLEIRDGFIRNVEGGLDAKLMTDWLDDNKASEDDIDPYAVSHLGWGLNPQALWYNIALNGDDPERSHAAARVFPGNFLFSTGPNTQGGGTRNTKGHYDVPMRDCTVVLDNDVIIERGKFRDEAMIVEREAR